MTATPRRTLAAAAIVAISLATPVAMSTAAEADPGDKHASTKAAKDAKPPKATKTKQAVKAISVRDAKLARLATADRTTQLADDHEAAFVANIDADRAALATLRSEVEAADSTLDSSAVRKELRAFRVVNYVLAGNILRQAEQVEDELAADPGAAANLEEAFAAALLITAESTKSDVREARDLLRVAKGEVESDEDEVPAPLA